MSIDLRTVPSPAFVLEEERLLSNLRLMADVQAASGAEIILALKAFAMWRVFPLVGQYLRGATASSLHEARLIFEEMGCKAHTYSPAYFPEEFDELLGYSSHITFNSLQQLGHYGARAAAAGVSVGLRVNPAFSDVQTDLYNPASTQSRLGELAANFDELPDWVEGLHCHTLCESTADASAGLIETFEKTFGHYLPHLKWVNFGGGHLMTREGYALDTLIAALRAFRQRHPQLTVILEPGSAVAWQTGVLLSRVLDIIDNGGVKTAITDISFTAHMPDTLEMPYRPRIYAIDAEGVVNRATDPPASGTATYRIGGVSCLAGDFMEAYVFDQALKVGDTLVFEDMIHYTMVKTTTFNGVKHPSICMLHTDGQLEQVRVFGYEDFKSRLS